MGFTRFKNWLRRRQISQTRESSSLPREAASLPLESSSLPREAASLKDASSSRSRLPHESSSSRLLQNLSFPLLLRVAAILQFLPLTVFVAVARIYNFSLFGWGAAFRYGAIAGALQLLILIPILRHRLNRLVAGVNLFLIVGGLAFYSRSLDVIMFLGRLREAGVLLAVAVVCFISACVSRTGVFENDFAAPAGEQKKFSFYFVAATLVATAWAYAFRGQTLLAGFLPFVFLVLLKNLFQKRLAKTTTPSSPI